MVLLFSLMLSFQSCTSCSNTPTDTVKAQTEVVANIDVDHSIALDRQEMFMKFGKDYRWWETQVHLKDFLNSDSATSTPEYVVNIFQSIIDRGNGYDTKVWKFRHYPDTTIVDSLDGFWIEDYPLNEEVIKYNYEAAFQRMLEANFPKPHSKNAILRNPIGPVTINAQWIFGNISEQIWIDAVTGEANSSNPAFPDSLGFKMPLGEWP